MLVSVSLSEDGQERPKHFRTPAAQSSLLSDQILNCLPLHVPGEPTETPVPSSAFSSALTPFGTTISNVFLRSSPPHSVSLAVMFVCTRPITCGMSSGTRNLNTSHDASLLSARP